MKAYQTYQRVAYRANSQIIEASRSPAKIIIKASHIGLIPGGEIVHEADEHPAAHPREESAPLPH